MSSAYCSGEGRLCPFVSVGKVFPEVYQQEPTIGWFPAMQDEVVHV